MTQITTIPPTLIQGSEPTGSKKQSAKSDPTVNVANSSVDKSLFTQNFEENARQNPDLPSSRLHYSPDGRTVLVQLNETGVETHNKLPLEQSEKLQDGLATQAPQMVKKAYVKMI